MDQQACPVGETVTNHYGETRSKCATSGRYLDKEGVCIVHFASPVMMPVSAGTDCDGYLL